MEFYLVNGSNRKKFNTAKLLNAAKEGILTELDTQNETANVEIINLYSLDFKGCKSCFHCKKIEGKYYGTCPIKDDLRELLPKLWESDGIIFGSPIYFRNVTGEMRSFLERLFFPKYVYGGKSIAKPKQTAFIYNMNVSEEISKEKYQKIYDDMDDFLEYAFKLRPYSLKVHNTCQFKDYSLYKHDFDEKEKLKHQKEQFPKDLNEAYNLGVKIVKEVLKNKK
jgi:multimeric flavodoxin WrbA